MTLAELIKIADAAYDDGLIELCFKKPNKDHGDTLAKFIAAELKDTFDEDASDDNQLLEASRCMGSAMRQLGGVQSAFDDAYGRTRP